MNRSVHACLKGVPKHAVCGLELLPSGGHLSIGLDLGFRLFCPLVDCSLQSLPRSLALTVCELKILHKCLPTLYQVTQETFRLPVGALTQHAWPSPSACQGMLQPGPSADSWEPLAMAA